MPARRQRPGLRLAVADHAGDDEVGVVERGPVRVRDRVPQLAALVHRARGLRRDMAGNPAGERELGEETLHALLVRGDIRVDLAVGPFEIGVGDQAGPAVPRTGDVEHVQVVFLDHPVQVDIDEVQAGRGPPVPQEPWLDVLLGQRLLEQRVVIEIDLADRQVVGGAPVRIDEREFLVRERASHDDLLTIRTASSRAAIAGRRPGESVPLSRRAPHGVAPGSPGSPPCHRCIGRDWRLRCTGPDATAPPGRPSRSRRARATSPARHPEARARRRS